MDFFVFFLGCFFVFWVPHVFSFFFWYFPFILLDFPVNSDVFFTFVLFFLAVPCVSYFFGFCSFHFATFLSLPMFLCSVFVVFWFFSFILVLSRHFKCVLCLFLAPHMSNFYVFSIFDIYTLILLGLLLSCPRFFRCVFPFFHYYLFFGAWSNTSWV